jgi:hypothetical protein
MQLGERATRHVAKNHEHVVRRELKQYPRAPDTDSERTRRIKPDGLVFSKRLQHT